MNKLTKVDITKNEQFSENFSKISPLNKIPVIIDNKEIVFESGAILIYLAKKNNFRFYNQKYEININEWLMVQVSFVGPMLGQLHFFYKFNKGKSEYADHQSIVRALQVAFTAAATDATSTVNSDVIPNSYKEARASIEISISS